jgi:VanZ family protein
MNGSHFGFFGVQAVLLYFSIKSTTYNLRSTVFAIIATSAFGYWIEVLQLSIPGRSYDLVDWALDTLGAIIFIAIIKSELFEKLLIKYKILN